jgi:hypothetical protein
MKVHFGKTKFPWQLRVRLASLLTKEGTVSLTDYQKGDISRAYGISFGTDRFVGIVTAGPFVDQRVRHAPPACWQHRVRPKGSDQWTEWREGRQHFTSDAPVEYEERPLYAIKTKDQADD